jgi:hypothetical protein
VERATAATGERGPQQPHTAVDVELDEAPIVVWGLRNGGGAPLVCDVRSDDWVKRGCLQRRLTREEADAMREWVGATAEEAEQWQRSFDEEAADTQGLDAVELLHREGRGEALERERTERLALPEGRNAVEEWRRYSRRQAAQWG